ncbi:MAG: sulfotransferase, partial [Pseudomonadota bacterium]
MLNRTGALVGKLGINPFSLDAGKILQQAAQVSGFDFSDDSMQLGLELLIKDIYANGRLNTFGQLAIKNLLNRNATARFQIEKVLHANPDIENEPIQQPVFIIGMPRSGTTVLHALLHCDPGHRSPLSWECLLPYPVPDPETYTDNPQLNQVRTEFEQLFRLVPDFKQKHYMEADSPQECLGLTALHFTSFQYLAQLYLPEYYHWLTYESDLVNTMRWHKRFLQYLQSGGVKGERWLLKSPVHLVQLKAIFEVYPDARIIMTHRHPAKVVPSASSLVSSVRSLYSDEEDPLRTGKEQLETWAYYYEQFLKDRKALDKESQIIDLHFEDFAANQMGLVETIYHEFGWTLTEQAQQLMRGFLAAQPKDKH